MKKLFKITFFVTLSLLFLFGMLVAAFAVSDANSSLSGISIIGGADGPTAVLVSRTLLFETPTFWVTLLTSVLFVVSAVGWAVTKKK